MLEKAEPSEETELCDLPFHLLRVVLQAVEEDEEQGFLSLVQLKRTARGFGGGLPPSPLSLPSLSVRCRAGGGGGERKGEAAGRN